MTENINDMSEVRFRGTWEFRQKVNRMIDGNVRIAVMIRVLPCPHCDSYAPVDAAHTSPIPPEEAKNALAKHIWEKHNGIIETKVVSEWKEGKEPQKPATRKGVESAPVLGATKRKHEDSVSFGDLGS